MGGIRGVYLYDDEGNIIGATGGLGAVVTNKKRHGEDFYKRIGAKGGKNGHHGGFYANRELARISGAKGGRISKRGKATKVESV